MRFLFLTALLFLRRLSLVPQTRPHDFSELAICNRLSHDRVNSVLQGTDGQVRFSAVPAVTVMPDVHVNFLTGNRMILPCSGADWNVVMTGANIFPR